MGVVIFMMGVGVVICLWGVVTIGVVRSIVGVVRSILGVVRFILGVSVAIFILGMVIIGVVTFRLCVVMIWVLIWVLIWVMIWVL